MLDADKSYIADIIQPSMRRRAARQALLAAGWEFVGGGSFAAVYGSPDGTRVAKVTKPDRGAAKTYEMANALRGNPHLPRYFNAIALIDGGHVYEAERLLPLANWEELEALEREFRNNDDYKAAFETLDDAWGCNDRHYLNAMRRAGSGELVLTDYLADMGQLPNASVCACDAAVGHFSDYTRSGSNHWLDKEAERAAA